MWFVYVCLQQIQVIRPSSAVSAFPAVFGCQEALAELRKLCKLGLAVKPVNEEAWPSASESMPQIAVLSNFSSVHEPETSPHESKTPDT